MVQSLTRTTRVLPVQSPVLSASTIRCRALSFTNGAQASSRSRNTWSAGRPWAFSRKRGLLPGTAGRTGEGRPGPWWRRGGRSVRWSSQLSSPFYCRYRLEAAGAADLADDAADDGGDIEVGGREDGGHPLASAGPARSGGMIPPTTGMGRAGLASLKHVGHYFGVPAGTGWTAPRSPRPRPPPRPRSARE